MLFIKNNKIWRLDVALSQCGRESCLLTQFPVQFTDTEDLNDDDLSNLPLSLWTVESEYFHLSWKLTLISGDLKVTTHYWPLVKMKSYSNCIRWNTTRTRFKNPWVRLLNTVISSKRRVFATDFLLSKSCVFKQNWKRKIFLWLIKNWGKVHKNYLSYGHRIWEYLLVWMITKTHNKEGQNDLLWMKSTLFHSYLLFHQWTQ